MLYRSSAFTCADNIIFTNFLPIIRNIFFHNLDGRLRNFGLLYNSDKHIIVRYLVIVTPRYSIRWKQQYLNKSNIHDDQYAVWWDAGKLYLL